jgi:uncharacterized small protein (DUF1192 family)
MYATEKYVKMEAKELRETLHELANDLGGDIRYLHSMVTELQASIVTLQQEIESIKDAIRGQ